LNCCVGESGHDWSFANDINHTNRVDANTFIDTWEPKMETPIQPVVLAQLFVSATKQANEVARELRRLVEGRVAELAAVGTRAAST
jgi:hypothetical protein